MKHIVVLGAGISGLSLAWELKKRHPRDCRITIIEKSARPGGWIQTIEKDGFLFEQGPRSCRPKGAGLFTLQLIEELGLQNQVITGRTTKRYLYMDGRIQSLPAGPLSFLFSSLTRGMLPAIFKDLITPKNSALDESIYDFFSRRFSAAITERLIDPMTLGIYAGDIRKLSMRSCFPQIYDWEKNHGSVIRGMFSRKKTTGESSSFVKSTQKHSLFSFKKGMHTLTNELSKRLESCIQLSTSATSLSFHTDHIKIDLSTGQSLHADHVYSTLSAKALSSLWPNPALSLIPANSIVVVNLGFRKKVHNKDGFGYLIPTSQGEPILGVVFDSCIFPQQNHFPDESRLTVMMRPNGIEEETAISSLSKHLNIDTPPDSISIFRANDAIPQYGVGHSTLLSNIVPPSSLFTILGSSFYGVSVNDCIHGGRSQ